MEPEMNNYYVVVVLGVLGWGLITFPIVCGACPGPCFQVWQGSKQLRISCSSFCIVMA